LIDAARGKYLRAAGVVQSRTGVHRVLFGRESLKAQYVGYCCATHGCPFEEQMEVFQTFVSGFPLFRIVGDVDHYAAPELEGAARKALALDHGRLLFDLPPFPTSIAAVSVPFSA
jgi:hypothetical protein